MTRRFLMRREGEERGLQGYRKRYVDYASRDSVRSQNNPGRKADKREDNLLK